MDQVNKILIAVELDKASEVVIEYGITLGLMLDAPVSCVHISRPIANRIIYDKNETSADDFEGLGEITDVLSLEKLEEQDLESLRSMVITVMDKMQMDQYLVPSNVRSDFAIPGILTEAEETGADLIIVGAHVDYKKKNFGITNLAKEVIELSPKSVIVVPTTYGNRNLDHMCMFVNFDFEELTMIQDMMQVSVRNEMHLTFIHILADEEKLDLAQKNLEVYKRLFLEEEEHDLISFKLEQGEISTVIENLVYDMDIDLIGIKSKKKHWNLLGLQKSFDSQVMDNIRVPLYVWKN